MMLLYNKITHPLWKVLIIFVGFCFQLDSKFHYTLPLCDAKWLNWSKSETLFFLQVNWESYTMWAWREYSVTIYLVWLTYSPVCYTWYSGTRLWIVAGRVVACPLSTSITGSPNKEHIIGTAHWGTHQEEHIIGRMAFCAQNSWRMELDSFYAEQSWRLSKLNISPTECILRSE